MAGSLLDLGRVYAMKLFHFVCDFRSMTVSDSIHV